MTEPEQPRPFDLNEPGQKGEHAERGVTPESLQNQAVLPNDLSNRSSMPDPRKTGTPAVELEEADLNVWKKRARFMEEQAKALGKTEDELTTDELVKIQSDPRWQNPPLTKS